jgi:hypothetical protein
MGKDTQAEVAEGKGWEVGIERTDEIFVKPLGFFDLKTDPLN